MQTLFVFYDPHCGVCTHIKEWLLGQPAYVRLQLVAQGSAEEHQLFPQLPTPAFHFAANEKNVAGKEELIVLADTGEYWTGDSAWIVCLWALQEFRDWALRLSSPALLPLARQAFVAFSSNRSAVSRLLGLRGEAELQRTLSDIPVPPCQI